MDQELDYVDWAELSGSYDTRPASIDIPDADMGGYSMPEVPHGTLDWSDPSVIEQWSQGPSVIPEVPYGTLDWSDPSIIDQWSQGPIPSVETVPSGPSSSKWFDQPHQTAINPLTGAQMSWAQVLQDKSLYNPYTGFSTRQGLRAGLPGRVLDSGLLAGRGGRTSDIRNYLKRSATPGEMGLAHPLSLSMASKDLFVPMSVRSGVESEKTWLDRISSPGIRSPYAIGAVMQMAPWMTPRQAQVVTGVGTGIEMSLEHINKQIGVLDPVADAGKIIALEAEKQVVANAAADQYINYHGIGANNKALVRSWILESYAQKDPGSSVFNLMAYDYLMEAYRQAFGKEPPVTFAELQQELVHTTGVDAKVAEQGKAAILESLVGYYGITPDESGNRLLGSGDAPKLQATSIPEGVPYTVEEDLPTVEPLWGANRLAQQLPGYWPQVEGIYGQKATPEQIQALFPQVKGISPTPGGGFNIGFGDVWGEASPAEVAESKGFTPGLGSWGFTGISPKAGGGIEPSYKAVTEVSGRPSTSSKVDTSGTSKASPKVNSPKEVVPSPEPLPLPVASPTRVPNEDIPRITKVMGIPIQATEGYKGRDTSLYEHSVGFSRSRNDGGVLIEFPHLAHGGVNMTDRTGRPVSIFVFPSKDGSGWKWSDINNQEKYAVPYGQDPGG